ncbi:MAG: OmpA family protein [Bacteriovoracaceae bacterium]|nr:OmpA family protein [Bacteriovoracaceae bacterium]
MSYADMITLLAAFFVLFFSTEFVQNQEQDLANSVDQTLQEMTQTIDHEAADGSEPIPDILKSQVIHISRQKDDFIVHFRHVSFFKKGQTHLTKEGEQALKTMAESITPYLGKYLLLIRAFTDKTPVRNKNSRYRDNVELSALRSVSAMRLLNKSGVPVTNMLVSGYGVFPEDLKSLVGIQGQDQNSLSLERSIVILLKRNIGKK